MIVMLYSFIHVTKILSTYHHMIIHRFHKSARVFSLDRR